MEIARPWHLKRHINDEGEALCRSNTPSYAKTNLAEHLDAVNCAKCLRIHSGQWPQMPFKTPNSPAIKF